MHNFQIYRYDPDVDSAPRQTTHAIDMDECVQWTVSLRNYVFVSVPLSMDSLAHGILADIPIRPLMLLRVNVVLMPIIPRSWVTLDTTTPPCTAHCNDTIISFSCGPMVLDALIKVNDPGALWNAFRTTSIWEQTNTDHVVRVRTF